MAAAVAAAAPQAEELAPTPEAQEQAEAEAERLTELEDEELEDLGEDDQEEVSLRPSPSGNTPMAQPRLRNACECSGPARCPAGCVGHAL